MPKNNIIQSLWVGDALSTMERLSIASFLAQGHDFHLYVYQTVANVPKGASILDARDVLPESMIFQYQDRASYSGFSNYFRYKLLLDRGGWWVDTDAVCLRPFAFTEEYVFSSEITRAGQSTPTSGYIKAPVGSEAMAFAWDQCLGKDPGQLKWGETGPRLVAEVVRRYAMNDFVQDFQVFAPVGHYDWKRIIEPGWTEEFPESTRAVHLWNERWRQAGQDKDAVYPSDCLYERLKTMYL